jgi:hypothetical protein
MENSKVKSRYGTFEPFGIERVVHASLKSGLDVILA